jgi:hypothetical protein
VAITKSLCEIIGYNYFAKKENEPYGICVTDESDAIGPIWDLSKFIFE